MSKKKIGILIGLLLGSSFASAAGGISSGGGDVAKTPFNDFAWFYGPNKTIKACLVVDPGFGLNRAEIVPQLLQAFGAWKDYIEKKQINLKHDFPDGRFMLTTQIDVDACEGKPDLTFYFGSNTPEILEAKKLYRDPVAMAILRDFDRKESWGNGFIWITPEKSLFDASYPNWHFKNNIVTILLHEFGHLYGNAHVPGTIMTEHIMSLLGSETSSTFKTSIDIFRELYHCDQCAMNLTGYSVTNSNGTANGTFRLLRKILGHPFSGSTRVTLSKGNTETVFQLTVTDEEQKTVQTFPIQVTGQRVIDGPYVFSRAWTGWSTSTGKNYYGYLVNPSGEKVNMVLESNLVDYSQSMPEYSTLMRVNGFVDGEFTELVTFNIVHELN